MKKLLVCLFAMATLVVFSGVAMAASPTVEVFTSCKSVKTTTCEPISFSTQQITESQTTADVTTGVPTTTLPKTTGTFTGFLVANVDVTPETGVNDIAISEVLFCGTFTPKGGTAVPVQFDFGDFATALSDTKSGTSVSVAVDMIGTGSLFMPPGTAVGPDYLNATVTGTFSPTTNKVTAIKASGNIAGGRTTTPTADLTTDLTTPADAKLFTATFSGLTLLHDTSCTEAATCSAAGVVVCTP